MLREYLLTLGDLVYGPPKRGRYAAPRNFSSGGLADSINARGLSRWEYFEVWFYRTFEMTPVFVAIIVPLIACIIMLSYVHLSNYSPVDTSAVQTIERLEILEQWALDGRFSDWQYLHMADLFGWSKPYWIE